MEILNEIQIKQKTKRIAIQILENNIDAPEIILAGVNDNGLYFAKNIGYYLTRMTEQKVTYAQVSVNPKNPLESDIEIKPPVNKFEGKTIILIDDVANSGRTIFYAFKPFLNIALHALEIAVLVNRTHKKYPISPNYIGISLATTVQEHISVYLKGVDKKKVLLT